MNLLSSDTPRSTPSLGPGAGVGPPAGRARNPVRISRIGSDHLEVHVRAPSGCAELSALVERLEQLIGVGYDAIDVIFENRPPDTRHRARTSREEH